MSVRCRDPFCHSILPRALKILRSPAQPFPFPCDKHHSPFHSAKPQTRQKRTFNCLIYPQPNPGCRTGRPPPVQSLSLRPLESSGCFWKRTALPHRASRTRGCSRSFSSLLGTLQMCCKDGRDFLMGFPPPSSWAFLLANILRVQHPKCRLVLKLFCYKITSLVGECGRFG